MNRCAWMRLFACATVCLAIFRVPAQNPAVLENHCDAMGSDITDSMKVDLLDPATPRADRQKALNAYMALVDERECPEYAYSIGLLYRFGMDLPGNLLQKDWRKAQDLILPYAEDGNLSAYADLAEMALAEGDAREGMQWTQVYLALLTDTDDEFRSGNDVFNRSGYNGDLLLRAEKAWKKQRPLLPRELISSDLMGYLNAQKAHFLERAMAHGDAHRSSSDEPSDSKELVPTVRGKCEVTLGDVGGAYARYLIEVQPDGLVSRVAIENFAPSPVAAMKLAQCVKVYEFKPFEGPAARTAIVPVVYGYTDGPRISK